VKPFGGCRWWPGYCHGGSCFTPRRQGDVVVRLNRQTLPLFEHGRRMELLPFLRGLKGKTRRCVRRRCAIRRVGGSPGS